ncbi:hypothetical protein [Alishewanella longhuensis]
MSKDFALLVLESPWWQPKLNPLRASALPFFKSLEALTDGFNCYYSTFYDTRGFELALAEDLKHTSEKKQILYIGAHGSESSIAGGNIQSVIKKAASHSKKLQGVIVSSCLVGSKTRQLSQIFFVDEQRTPVKWLWAYNCAVGWLNSMMLEIAIIEALVQCEDLQLGRRANILKVFSQALNKFNPQMVFGAEGESLIDSFVLLWANKDGVTIDLATQLKTLCWKSIY